MINTHIHVNATITPQQAWEISRNDQQLNDLYRSQAQTFGLSTPYEFGPHWAYWFARQVIGDQWELAEELIKTDHLVWRWYNDYIKLCNDFGLISYSIKGSDDFIVDDDGIIIAWKDGHKPVRRDKVQVSLEDVADQIAARIAEFKKTKKMRKLINENNDDDNCSSSD